MRVRHLKISTWVAILTHPVVISVAAVGSVLGARDRRDMATRLAVALPLGVGASKLLKHAFPRRKPNLFSLSRNERFPSGHSAGIAAYAGSLAVASGGWPVAIAAIAFVNAARLAAREHRPIDVLVGDAIGLTAAAVGAKVAARVAP